MCRLVQGVGDEGEENSEAAEKSAEADANKATHEKSLDPSFAGVKV
jgi:hypothetical protein